MFFSTERPYSRSFLQPIAMAEECKTPGCLDSDTGEDLIGDRIPPGDKGGSTPQITPGGGTSGSSASSRPSLLEALRSLLFPEAELALAAALG